MYIILLLVSYVQTGQLFKTSPILYLDEFIPITDSQPHTFGYPSQVLLQSKLLLDLLSKRSNNLQVIFYGQQKTTQTAINPPSKRLLVFSLDTQPKSYIAISFILRGWPRYSIQIVEKLLTHKLIEIQQKYKITEFNPDFPFFYKNIHDYLLKEPEFQLLLIEYQKSPSVFEQNNLNLEQGEGEVQGRQQTAQQNQQSEQPEDLYSMLNHMSQKPSYSFQEDADIDSLINQSVSKVTSNEMSQQAMLITTLTQMMNQGNDDDNKSAFDKVFKDPTNYANFKRAADLIIDRSPQHELQKNLDNLLAKHGIKKDELSKEELFELQKTFDLRNRNRNRQAKSVPTQKKSEGGGGEMMFNENGELIKPQKTQQRKVRVNRAADPNSNRERVQSINSMYGNQEEEIPEINSREDANKVLLSYKRKGQKPPAAVLEAARKFAQFIYIQLHIIFFFVYESLEKIIFKF